MNHTANLFVPEAAFGTARFSGGTPFGLMGSMQGNSSIPPAQFDNKLSQIDRCLADKAHRLARSRMNKTKLRCMQGLAAELEPGKYRFKQCGSAAIDRIAQ